MSFQVACIVFILTLLTPLELIAQDASLAPQALSQDRIELSNAITTPDGPVLVEANIEITMRDGIALSMDIYRPATPGQYPTLYAAAPYPHHSDTAPPQSPETGPVAWLVNQGYNYVLVSTRGTGLSEGFYEFLSLEEQRDHYEVIEWIAEQQWSNGQVIGFGAGYYATSQWFMAIQNPPHLECIAPYNGTLSPFQDWAYPGGLASSDFSQIWYEQSVRDSNKFSAQDQSRLVEYDLRLQQLAHDSYDEYWQRRSALENANQITIPVLMLRSWDQSIPGLQSNFTAYDLLSSEHKMLLTADSTDQEMLLDRSLLETELLNFYQWCLNDQGLSSYIVKPRIRYYVRGQDQIKPENSWPPGNIEFTPLYLSNNGMTVDPLTLETKEEEDASLTFTAQQTNSGSSVYGSTGITSTEEIQTSAQIFVSETLEQDMEITGPLMMELYASSTSPDTAFEVIVSEQLVYRQFTDTQFLPTFLNPGTDKDFNLLTAYTELEVSSGTLKASSRALDPEQSEDFLPVYAQNEAALLTPSVVYRFDIALQPTAYRFKQGNRIVIKIRKAVDGSLRGHNSQETIFYSTRFPSRLWMPKAQSIISTLSTDSTSNAEEEQTSPSLIDFLQPTQQDEIETVNIFDSNNPVIFMP